MKSHFVPKNEQGVIYLFSRYHEELGFEKILHITTSFPDVIALRNGKEIKIELEFGLSGFLKHYIAYRIGYRQEWSYMDGYWIGGHHKIPDPDKTKYYMFLNILYYHSIKDYCDCVIFWERSSVWQSDEKLPDDIEVICLKDIFNHPGVEDIVREED